MTKFETKQAAQVEIFLAHDMADTAARALSSLVRCARNEKSLRELLARAGISETKRAEEIDVAGFVALANVVTNA